MKIDPTKSEIHERKDASDIFSRSELRYMRQLLRRARFLEAQIRDRGGMNGPDANGGAAWAELELAAFEFALVEMEYAEIRRIEK